MKITLSQLENATLKLSSEDENLLQKTISEVLPDFEEEFVQDLTHVSPAAAYKGNMTIDRIEHLKDNLYRCEYSYDWEIAWTCSGTQEAGREKEKVRFTVNNESELDFKFLKLDH